MTWARTFRPKREGETRRLGLHERMYSAQFTDSDLPDPDVSRFAYRHRHCTSQRNPCHDRSHR